MSGTPESLSWRRSSYCDAGTCVEIARPGSGALIRDSKDLSVGAISLNAAQWSTFLADVKAGRYDV